MNHLVRVSILTIIVGLVATTANATWGDYDPTFGFLGMAIDNVAEHYPLGVAVQSDGKILVTGYKIFAGKKRFFLRRYLSNGQLDTSFGSNGAAIANAPVLPNSDYAGSRIVVQADGRIAVAGLGNSRPTIWRFLASGSADTSIGVGGMKALNAYDPYDPGIATHLNVLYIGVVKTPSTLIIKFNSDGSQDTSFGTSGEAATDAGNEFLLDVDPTSGNVLIGGRRRSDIDDFGVERFLPTGVLDPGFSHWGGTNNGWPYVTYRFMRRSNGQFVMNERVFNISGGGVTVWSKLVRLNSAGAFTSRTTYETANILANTCPEVLAEQQDGKVVVRGASAEHLYRFAANFSSIQTISCTAYSLMETKSPAVLQTDNKMLSAGRYNGNLVIVRTIP